MYLSVQLPMCFLFITIFGNIYSLAILRRDLGIASSSSGAPIHRVPRQVVQPTWSLNSEGSLFEDYNVRVTDEKLEETEAIRDYIQETVDSDTYVVELDEGDFEEDEIQTDEEPPAAELGEPAPQLEVETIPTSEPVPEPELSPEPEPSPEPEQKPTVKVQQTNAPQPGSKRSMMGKLKKRYSAGSPFRIWLRKKFNN